MANSIINIVDFIGSKNPGKAKELISQANSDENYYNRVLNVMYTQGYNQSYKNFDDFKSSYEGLYGSPFKKKEQTAPQTQNGPTPENIPQSEFDTQGFQPSSTLSDVYQPSSNKYITSLLDKKLQSQSQDFLIQEQKPREGDAPAFFSKNLNNQVAPITGESTSVQPNTPQSLGGIQNTSTPNTSYLEGAQQILDANVKAIKDVVDFTSNLPKYSLDALAEFISAPQNVVSSYETMLGLNQGDIEKATAKIAPFFGSTPVGVALGMFSVYDNMKKQADQLVPPEDRNKYASAVGQGAFTVASLYAGGGSSGLLGNTANMGGKILGAASNPASYNFYAQGFKGAYDDAIANGASVEEARQAGYVGGGIEYASEFVPTSLLLKRLDKISGGAASDKLLKGIAGNTIEEAISEATAQWASNLYAGQTYDQTRDMWEGVWDAAKIGAVSGGVLSGTSLVSASVIKNLEAKKATTTDPKEIEDLDKSLEFTKQIQDKSIVAENEANNLKYKTQAALVQGDINKAWESETPTKAMATMQELSKNLPIDTKVLSGIDQKINKLQVEKDNLFATASTPLEVEAAKKRSSEIDNEIKQSLKDRQSVIINEIDSTYPVSQSTQQEDATNQQLQPERQGADEQLQLEGDNRSQQATQQESGDQTSTGSGIPAQVQAISAQQEAIKKEVKKIVKKVQQIPRTIMRNIRQGGNLPMTAVYKKIGKEGQYGNMMSKAIKAEKAFKKIERKERGNSPVTQEYSDALMAVARGEKPARQLSPKVVDAIKNLRAELVSLTKKAIDEGVYDTGSKKLEEVVNENINEYFKREYEMYRNPEWTRENIKPEVIQNAVTALRKAYTDFHKEKIRKVSDKMAQAADRFKQKTEANNVKLESALDKLDQEVAKLESVKKNLKNKAAIKEMNIQIAKLKKINNKKKSILAKKWRDASNNLRMAYETAEQRGYNKIDELNKTIAEGPSVEDINKSIDKLLHVKPKTEVMTPKKTESVSSDNTKKRSEFLEKYPELRALKGEITDVSANFLNTYSMIAKQLATHRYTKELSNILVNSGLAKTERGGEFQNEIGDSFGQKGYKVDGKPIYVSNDTIKSLEELTSGYGLKTDGLFFKALRTLNFWLTVSPKGILSNAAGSVIMTFKGGINPHMIKTYGDKAELAKHIEAAKDRGVVGSGVSSTYVREQFDLLFESGSSLKINQNVKNAYKSVANVGGRAFAMADDFGKLNRFIQEVGYEMYAEPNLTFEEASDRAAQITLETTPTTSMAMPWVQKFRNNPILGSLALMYTMEDYRANFRHIQHIIENGKSSNPRRKIIAAYQSISYISGIGLIAAISKMAASYIGMDDDEEEAVNAFAAPFDKEAPKLYLSLKDGKAEYASLARFAPDEPMLEIIRIMSDEKYKGQSIESRLAAVLAKRLEDIVEPNALAGLLFNASNGKDDMGNPIYSDFDHPWTKVMKSLEAASKKAMPTVARGGLKLKAALTTGEYSGRPITVGQATANIFGVDVKSVDLKKQYENELYAVARTMEADLRNFKRVINMNKVKPTDNPKNVEDKKANIETEKELMKTRIMMALTKAQILSDHADAVDIKVSNNEVFKILGINQTGERNLVKAYRADYNFGDEDLEKLVDKQINLYISQLK
jgi:hypothetical protein